MKKYKAILSVFFCMIICLSVGIACSADSISNNSNGIIGSTDTEGFSPPTLSDEIDSRELWGEDARDIKEGENRLRGNTEGASQSVEGSQNDDMASLVLIMVLILLTFLAAAFLIYIAFRSAGSRKKDREMNNR